MRYIKKKKGATFVWELPEAAKLGERHINGGKMHLSKIIKHSGFYYFTYTHKQKHLYVCYTIMHVLRALVHHLHQGTSEEPTGRYNCNHYKSVTLHASFRL